MERRLLRVIASECLCVDARSAMPLPAIATGVLRRVFVTVDTVRDECGSAPNILSNGHRL